MVAAIRDPGGNRAARRELSRRHRIPAAMLPPETGSRTEQDRLKAENQQLRDEINRLKGTPGRPKGPQGRPPKEDVSSEAERRVPRGRIKGPKNDADAETLLQQRGLSAGVRRNLTHLPWDTELDEPTLLGLLDRHVANAGPTQRQWIVEALALAAYRAATDEPVVQLLLSDDAPQLSGICAQQALCWVHDGRHDKKLRPRVALHDEQLRDFRKDYWAFYHELRAYQEAPTVRERKRLATRCDQLCATITGYEALDDRIAQTRAKRTELLQVLTHPELPLHNNAAELGYRARVRRRGAGLSHARSSLSERCTAFVGRTGSSHRPCVKCFAV